MLCACIHRQQHESRTGIAKCVKDLLLFLPDFIVKPVKLCLNQVLEPLDKLLDVPKLGRGVSRLDPLGLNHINYSVGRVVIDGIDSVVIETVNYSVRSSVYINICDLR